MAHVFLSLGSNIHRQKHLRAGLDALAECFGVLTCSPVYESEAVGFEGDPFYNLVVGLQTDLSISHLQEQIKAIEDENGRARGGPKFSARTLDIDILTYDDCVGNFEGVQLPRDEITRNAFVLRPLCDLAPEAIHPQQQKSYAELWRSYDQLTQNLWLANWQVA